MYKSEIIIRTFCVYACKINHSIQALGRHYITHVHIIHVSISLLSETRKRNCNDVSQISLCILKVIITRVHVHVDVHHWLQSIVKEIIVCVIHITSTIGVLLIIKERALNVYNMNYHDDSTHKTHICALINTNYPVTLENN